MRTAPIPSASTIPLSSVVNLATERGNAVDAASDLGLAFFPVRRFELPHVEEIHRRLASPCLYPGRFLHPANLAICNRDESRPPKPLLRPFVLAGHATSGVPIKFKGRSWFYVSNGTEAHACSPFSGVLIKASDVRDDLKVSGVLQQVKRD